MEKIINKEIKISKMRRSWNNLSAMYELTMVSFMQNKGAIFFTLFFPVLLLGIFGAVFNNMGSGAMPKGILNSTIAGISVAAITGNGLNGLSVRLAQWKQSTIIKRIGATPLKKWEFLVAALFFYINIMMFQAIWIVIWSFIFFHSQIGLSGEHSTIITQKAGKAVTITKIIQLHPFFIIVGLLLTMLFSVSLGVLLASFLNDVNTISSIAIMIFLPAAFLSGQYIPLSTIDAGPPNSALSIISKIWPQRYLVAWMYHGWGALQVHTQNGIPNSIIDAVDWNTQNIILGILYPPIISIGAIVLATKLFKWE